MEAGYWYQRSPYNVCRRGQLRDTGHLWPWRGWRCDWTFLDCTVMYWCQRAFVALIEQTIHSRQYQQDEYCRSHHAAYDYTRQWLLRFRADTRCYRGRQETNSRG